MKLIFIIHVIIFYLFILPIPTYAQQDPLENPDRPYMTDGLGNGVNPGDKKKSSDEIFEDFLDIFFKRPTGGTNGSEGTPRDNSTGPSTNPSAIPTPLNSLTPFPTISIDVDVPQGTLTYSSEVIAGVQNCLKNQAIYKQASSQTNIPWQYLAAIHYMEGNCNPNQSLVSGRVIGNPEPDVGKNNCSSQVNQLGKPIPVKGGCGFTNLLSTAIYAGNHLSGKIGKPPQTQQELAKAFGRYNGIGNANCDPQTGRPRTPYQYCPAAYEGDDHIYATSKLDAKHEFMYLRYCADGQLCTNPPVFQRIGALTVVHIISNILNAT